MLSTAISLLVGCVLRQTYLIIGLLLEKWIWVSIILCLGSTGRFVKSYLMRRPDMIPTFGLPTMFGQWLTSLIYHVVGMYVVRDGYQKVRLHGIHRCDKKLKLTPVIGKWEAFCSSRFE